MPNQLINNLNSEEIEIKYLEFSFERNLTLNESIEPEILFKSLFYNQIFINLKVGANKIEIPFYIYLQQYHFVVQSANVDNGQVKGLYNESSSISYQKIKDDYYALGDMNKGIISKENFYLFEQKNKNNQSYFNFDFSLCKENRFKTHITEGGKIGFKMIPPVTDSDETNFIKNLKNSGLIDARVFLLKYNSTNISDDKGKLIIGSFPHLYDEIHYKEEYYINDNAEKGYSDIEWIYNFDEIELDNYIIENNTKGYFYSELGYIIASKYFFNDLKQSIMWKKYFNVNSTTCHEIKFIIDDVETKEIQQKLRGEYIGYYCDKDVIIEEINIYNISFFKRNLNYIFNISFSDLWIEVGDYKLFMIIEKIQIYNDFWYLGKPFLQKYEIVFDHDNKQIGFYKKIIEIIENDSSHKKTNNKMNYYIFAIIGLCCIIGVLIFIIIKCYMKLPRRKKANELEDDNYIYEVKTKNENLLN